MLNNITIQGRFVKDLELKYTSSQTPVVSFALAVERDYSGKDSARETDFIDCVAWRGTAEFLSKYFGKGSMTIVTGKLQTRTWEDKEGNKRKTTEVLVSNAYFCGSKNSEVSEWKTSEEPSGLDHITHTSGAYEDAYVEMTDDDGELPF